ncbi:MAG TPA: VWA domain-containing protein [Spirochaetota bacterium]|nr:VWA domain-containing protein [Spirochaetota bacterium]
MKSVIPTAIKTAVILPLVAAAALYAAGPFGKDADHDGFPDDLELATGHNPRVNEALKKSAAGGKCGVITTDLLKLGRPHNVLVILDISGSMREPLGDSSRMDVAKKILARYIDALPSGMKLGFVIYGKTDCGDESVEIVAPVGRLNRAALKERIADLSPRGSTPIALALGKVAGYFKGFEADNNHLILISDGMESCGGDPIRSIIELKESDADPEVTIIGLGVDPATRAQLFRIAASSDGVYADVKSEKDFIGAFAQFFNRMNRFFKDIVCIVSQYNAYLTYETEQYNKSKTYLVKASTRAFDDGARAALKNAEDLIDHNHSARMEARDTLNEMIRNKMDEMEKAANSFVGRE